ncbi:MAG: TldD/PmbA family protein [Verrucomicrobia bacterium]|nr:MAG: TldD/PmbA family protein [Verrucomicrobiota bacterium]
MSVPNLLLKATRSGAAEAHQRMDQPAFRNLADVALRAAKKFGASYADIRVCKYHNESIFTREDKVQSISDSQDVGFGVRVLLDGSWGFASSNRIHATQIQQTTQRAIEIAKATRSIQRNKVELETVPAYDAAWVMPMKTDPFTVSTEEKVKMLLAVNAAALKAGANFCTSFLLFVKEEKFFASSRGSCLHQIRVRTYPHFELTAINKDTGRFATRDSLAAPRGSGYEYVAKCDLVAEASKAAEEARMKLAAKPVTPGRKDLVIHPTNLWLTIHESIGHPTELDRALGYEANYAGTSFVTTDKLGRLKYGSELINIVGDRTQKEGLATVGYDDDGVGTEGAEFHIIKNGRFENYQTALGQAAWIGRSKSNACAFADSWDKIPLQRMPNISLEPGEKEVAIEELFADVKNGIYIIGDGSWSIDQQRYNFQFGGQLFYEIKNGRLGQMLRDVAYQGNTIDFWNACDGLCGKKEYFLGGSFSCGKGQPGQLAPVSHGAVPARFRNINVLNTERSDL